MIWIKVLRFSNPAPIPEIVSPEDGADVLEGMPVTFYGSVTDANHPPEELITFWTLNDEVVCDEIAPNIAGDIMCSMTILDEEATIKLIARDLDNARGEDSISVLVVPTEAPTVEIISPFRKIATMPIKRSHLRSSMLMLRMIFPA